LIAVHVVRSDGTAVTSATEIERQRLLVEHLGGSLQLIVGDDIAGTVLATWWASSPGRRWQPPPGANPPAWPVGCAPGMPLLPPFGT
jgi:hypothetical protein